MWVTVQVLLLQSLNPDWRKSLFSATKKTDIDPVLFSSSHFDVSSLLERKKRSAVTSYVTSLCERETFAKKFRRRSSEVTLPLLDLTSTDYCLPKRLSDLNWYVEERATSCFSTSFPRMCYSVTCQDLLHRICYFSCEPSSRVPFYSLQDRKMRETLCVWSQLIFCRIETQTD